METRIKVGAAAVVALALLGGGLAIGLSGSDDRDSPAALAAGESTASAEGPSDSTATCSTAPTAELSGAYRVGSQFQASMTFSSGCAGGAVVSSDGLNVVLTEGSRMIASGTFDLSTGPIVIPAGSETTVDLIFPAGSFWVFPDDVRAQETSVELTDTGVSSIAEGDSSRTAQSTSSLTVASSYVPPGRDSESLSFAGLQDMRQSDDASIRSDIVDRWVPQLSSKQVGLVADGIVWNNQAILDEQFSYRTKFPQTKLVWSGDYSSFSVLDWWVTVVDVPFPDAAGANAWCDSNGLDKDHCFAKRVTNSTGPQQTTVYRR